MEKATTTLRRSGAFILSFGTGHQDLNLIIAGLKGLKSQVKALRDSQQSVLQEITTWANAHDNKALKEVFVHLTELNTLWTEVQTHFADQLADFRHQFEMILEGEKNLDAARNELSNCEVAEQKAIKKLRKAEKKTATEEIKTAQAKAEACEKQKELIQNEVSEKAIENEAVKFIRLKDGLLKLSEAYLELSHKCIYIFEAQRDIVKSLPDVEDKQIHEMRFDGLPGAENILQRAKTCVEEYRGMQQSGQRGREPPPPYSVNSFYSTPPFNPYYLSLCNSPGDPSQQRSDGPSSLYPSVRNDEELASAMNAARISQPGAKNT